MAANSPEPAAVTQPLNYTFPTDRLRLTSNSNTKTPLVLVACGSFSPITYLHLRMFEMASDYAKFNTDFEVVGGYLSPVGDAYKKKGLAAAVHRLAMCRLAVASAAYLMVDDWEAKNPKYMPTALVLDHFEHEINRVRGGVERPDGTRVPAKICLLAGADLIGTMSTPNVWSPADLDHILGRYGTFIVERTGTDIDDAIATLQPYKDNIWVIQQLIQNDVSSTKIRMHLRREMSVQYLIPETVIQYIEEHDLYNDDSTSTVEGKGKARGESGRVSPVGASKS